MCAAWQAAGYRYITILFTLEFSISNMYRSMHCTSLNAMSQRCWIQVCFLQHKLRTHPDWTAYNVPATDQIFMRDDFNTVGRNLIPLTLLTATRLLHTRTPPTNSAWIPSRSRTCLKSDRRGSLMNTDWWPGTWGEHVLLHTNTQEEMFLSECLSSGDQLYFNLHHEIISSSLNMCSLHIYFPRFSCSALQQTCIL